MLARVAIVTAVGLVVTVAVVGCAHRPTLEPSAVAQAVQSHQMAEAVKKALPEGQRDRGWEGGGSDSRSADLCRTEADLGMEGLRIPGKSGEEVLRHVAVGLKELVTQNGGSVTAHMRCVPFDNPTRRLGSHFDYTAPTPNQKAPVVEGRVEVWLTRSGERTDAPYDKLTVKLTEIVSPGGSKR
ncbi:MAG: hypothetical protein FJX75_21510 [Armatimonadetes bacterium]|nr:hypothetical protein [Armatimonadota bacterium]